MKECRSCGRLFKPSSRHLRCPACRRQASRDFCGCGNPKQPTSSTCRTCQPTALEANGNWRGGKTFHKAGYVMRRVPGHPRAHPSSPYVFEHILVMEEKIGRNLLPDESVHHLNVELGGIEPPSAERLPPVLRPFPRLRLDGYRTAGSVELALTAGSFSDVNGLSRRQRSFSPSSTASVAGLQRTGPACSHESR